MAESKGNLMLSGGAAVLLLLGIVFSGPCRCTEYNLGHTDKDTESDLLDELEGAILGYLCEPPDCFYEGMTSAECRERVGSNAAFQRDPNTPCWDQAKMHECLELIEGLDQAACETIPLECWPAEITECEE